MEQDDGDEQRREQDQAWNNLQGAIREFVTRIGESSKQLATAAEKFAGESFQSLGDAASNAQGRTRDEMASAASQAADEARRIAQSIHEAVSGAGARARSEARHAAEEVAVKAENARQSAERARAEIDLRLQEALQRLEAALIASREILEGVQRTAAEAPQASSSAPAETTPDPPARQSPPASGASSEAELPAGRIRLRLAPVPDADRLLDLDEALRRMNGVHNPMLIYYADEAVTFRVELEAPVPVAAFVQSFAAASGSKAEVVSAEADGLILRLVN
jgi:hypothetical protein